ncbi:hypothetical protein SKAU_G00226410 [Synaphobranchus kaupii]|uniref:Uncharacterized protein n=1 Tax=Synaphobranchus kaupii TaxID=118154 RepID=A0A9Q1F500_SYNKA|nr:hypothetical protein SKAU_G00226410 [Synaphobranchus kaupii]
MAVIHRHPTLLQGIPRKIREGNVSQKELHKMAQIPLIKHKLPFNMQRHSLCTTGGIPLLKDEIIPKTLYPWGKQGTFLDCQSCLPGAMFLLSNHLIAESDTVKNMATRSPINGARGASLRLGAMGPLRQGEEQSQPF